MQERFKKNYADYLQSIRHLPSCTRIELIQKLREYNYQQERRAASFALRDFTVERVFVLDIHRWYHEGWTEAEIANILRLNIESVLAVLALPLTKAEVIQIECSGKRRCPAPGLDRKWSCVT